ncbi:MAG: YiiG family protein [Acidobacteria bacterium]|nr:YiiG family protein [Acidobacteriota bacterium]
MQQRTTSRPVFVLVFVSLVLAATLGCARISELVKKGRGEAPPVPPTPTNSQPGRTPGNIDTDQGDSLVKKTNFYITDCYNRYSNRVTESHNRYASWVKNLDQGPTGKESIVYGLYDVNGDGADCETAVASAKALEPSMPELDEAADKYVTALKDVIGQIRGVYAYYEQEDYKDDNFAKGKAAHAGLMSAFKAFQGANDAFQTEVDKLEDSVSEKELTRLTEAGKHFDALVVESGIKAKKIKNYIQEHEFEAMKADDISPLIEDFSTTVEQLRTDDSKSMGDSYVRSCDEFTKASKEMMRRIRDGKKFSDSERRFIGSGAGWMVDGSPQKVIKAYNDMIQSRQFTRF